MKISPIINVSELLEIYTSQDVIIVDASNGQNARSNFEVKHLDGAIFIDVNTQLAEIKKDISIGGRHPLPKIQNFAYTLAELGISSNSHVVIYDNNSGSNAAARFWWMLKAVGHEKVQVLNGGFQEAEKNNFPISSNAGALSPCEPYKADRWELKLADIAEVENVLHNENYKVIDVRSSDRFNGEIEPIDLIAGHIPSAINVPFTENLDRQGLFLSPEVLKLKYVNLFKNLEAENIIVHCGSGVTACHSLLAIAYAKLEIPKLYVGSWSEWSRNNKEIERKTKD